MKTRKKILAAVLLIAVIAAAGLVILKGAGLLGGAPRPPDYVLARPMEMMDRNSMELMTKTRGQWEDLGKDEMGWYKNPKTGEYTMKPPLICASCRKKIPHPLLLLTDEMKSNLHVEIVAMAQLMVNYKCPLCGKQATAPMAGPGPGPAHPAPQGSPAPTSK